jgi:hypothetical protein
LAHPRRAEHFDEVLHGASIFSPLTTTATFDNRINYRPPTQWLVDPPPLLVMDLEHACYAVFGRPSMRYANLRHLDNPHEHLEFYTRAGSRSATSDTRLSLPIHAHEVLASTKTIATSLPLFITPAKKEN